MKPKIEDLYLLACKQLHLVHVLHFDTQVQSSYLDTDFCPYQVRLTKKIQSFEQKESLPHVLPRGIEKIREIQTGKDVDGIKIHKTLVFMLFIE